MKKNITTKYLNINSKKLLLMYLTYKDCKLSLDGIEYYASDVSISVRNKIEPQYLLGDRLASYYW